MNFIGYFTTWTNGYIGQAHLAFAIIALLAGAWVISTRKATRLHRLVGYTYVIAMLMLNGTALLKYDLTGAPNMFHFFAIGSLLTITAAYIAIRIRGGRRTAAAKAHGELMIWSYFGLVMALIAEIVTRAYPSMLHGDGGWSRFTSVLLVFSLIAALFTYRFIQFELAKTFSR
jgi:uncharacterized membrane protein